MSSNTSNEDLRSIKTEKALFEAMFSLLKHFTFRKITIKGICEEALISRAAFYAHYIDKYDLLKHWIAELWDKNFANFSTYEQLEMATQQNLQENMTVIKNLVYDADNETLLVLFEFILSTINLSAEKNNTDETNLKNIVLSNFYAGGFLSYILWQVKNKFPDDVPLLNKHLYEIIHMLQEWRSR